MTCVGVGPQPGAVRIKVLKIITPGENGDKTQTKEIIQQYEHGRWCDVRRVEETIRMEPE